MSGAGRLRRADAAGPTAAADLLLERITSGSVDELLELVRTYAGMDAAFVGEFSQGRRIVRYVSGSRPARAVLVDRSDDVVDTYCRLIAEGRLPTSVIDVADVPELLALDITVELDIASYVGVPIHLSDGALYGTLCCFSNRTRSPGSDDLTRVMTAAAELIARRLESPEHRFVDVLASQDRIRAVLDERHGFDVVFQPIVELGSRNIVGYEALSRFPGDPAETPEGWFADAHRAGLGVELELEAVRRALAVLPSLPPEAYLAVNVGGQALRDEALCAALDVRDRSRVVIELTEQERVLDTDLLATRAWLRDEGIRFAVDDLGSGYAGLSRLLELQPDIVKFDRYLTMGVARDHRRQALATATAGFCRDIAAELITEGVERESDRDALLGIGVRYAQGFLFGRPASSTRPPG